MASSISLPELFLTRLASIVPAESLASVTASFAVSDPLCVRVNTLKTDVPGIQSEWEGQGFTLKSLPFTQDAFILEGGQRQGFSDQPWVRQGVVYPQAASSLIPAVILDPHPGEMVLDACAAPGSKTSQIAAMMMGQGEVVAVESVKGRFYKLRSVCELLGATNVRTKLIDARRLRFDQPTFERVLVDAPCSSEGRFKTFLPKSVAYWSERKIKEMSHKQKGILLNAARALKVGGRLVYSTCTFAPEENEEVVDWFLRKTDGAFRLEPVDVPGVKRYAPLKAWKNREYERDLASCLRVLPDGVFSAFFIACFSRDN